MSYSKKDYNYLLLLKERVSRAKANFVNSYEIYFNYSLLLGSKYGFETDLKSICYVEWEKITNLFHVYLVSRHIYEKALTDLFDFREYLHEEYCKKKDNDA